MNMATAMATEGVLKDYTAIHDRLFHARWWKVWFPENFAQHAVTLLDLKGQLTRLQGAVAAETDAAQDREGTELLRRYISELTDTIGQLGAIVERNASVAAAKGSYQLDVYLRDCDNYETAAAKHLATGVELTTMIRRDQARALATPAPPELLHVSQAHAAALLWNGIQESVYAEWPAIYDGVRESHPTFVIRDIALTLNELASAVLAMELQAIATIGPPDLAADMRRQLFIGLELNEPSGAPRRERLDAYTAAWDRGIAIGYEPMLSIPRLWVERVLGPDAKQFRTGVAGRLDLIFMGLVASYVNSFIGQWKRVRESVVIVHDIGPCH